MDLFTGSYREKYFPSKKKKLEILNICEVYEIE